MNLSNRAISLFLFMVILSKFVFTASSQDISKSPDEKKKPQIISEKNAIPLDLVKLKSPYKLISILEDQNFLGDRVTLNFRNVDIRKIIKSISMMVGYEIEIGPGIGGKVTYHLNNSPWNIALSSFLTHHNLEIKYDGKKLKIEKRNRRILQSYGAWIIVFLIIIGLAALTIRYKIKFFKKKAKKRPQVNFDRADEFTKKIVFLLEVEKIYQDEELSLPTMASRLSIPQHQLSKIVNEQLGRSFSDLINFYRVEEAKQKLSDPREKNTKILDIAFDAGFSTKTAFNRTFKKFTHLTPSQFKKKYNKA